MAKHSPLPWYDNGPWGIYAAYDVDTADRRANGEIIPPPEKIVARVLPGHGIELEEQAANLEFIVRACNAHEDLLAACELAWNFFEDIAADGRDVTKERKQLLAAILKAKEQQSA